MNAFDLARQHLYGSLDDDAKEGTQSAAAIYERMKSTRWRTRRSCTCLTRSALRPRKRFRGSA